MTDPTRTTWKDRRMPAVAVRARRAEATSIRRAAFRDHVLASLWFVPACFAVAAIVLSRATIVLDHTYHFDREPGMLLGDAATMTVVASTIAAAMLTFLGVVFTTTLVAVQLASSQYSPRIVRLFVRSRLTQFTLGTVLATFVFALHALIEIRQSHRAEVPTLTIGLTYLLVTATIVMFIAFLHGMVRLLRVQYLVRLTADASRPVVEQAFPPPAVYADAAAPVPAPTPRAVHLAPDTRGRHHPHVLQAVDLGGLAALAARHDAWIELCVPVGASVGSRTAVARVHGADPAGPGDAEIREHLLFGHERSLLQDPGFGLRQLVDIASRALSPAVNDPTTAVQALHRITDLLACIADRPDPTGWYTDANGAVRLLVPGPDFERLARLGLTELLVYGADAPQVTRALAAAYDEIAAVASPVHTAVIAAMRSEYTRTVAATTALPTGFATTPDPVGLG
jgi:uncharacterized membrane protein